MPITPDEFVLGDWNAACFRCGSKRKASTMRRQWQGYYVCPEHWEPRQPQDFVRGIAEKPAPPWVQAEADVYIGPIFCTPQGSIAIPNYAIPDCSIPNTET